MSRQASVDVKRTKKRFEKSLVKGIKILLTKKKNKKGEHGCEHCKNISKNEKQKLVEYSRIYEMRKNKRLFNKVSVSSYKSKNRVILGWSRLWFLAIKAVEIRVILGQSEVFETKYIEFLY